MGLLLSWKEEGIAALAPPLCHSRWLTCSNQAILAYDIGGWVPSLKSLSDSLALVVGKLDIVFFFHASLGHTEDIINSVTGKWTTTRSWRRWEREHMGRCTKRVTRRQVGWWPSRKPGWRWRMKVCHPRRCEKSPFCKCCPKAFTSSGNNPLHTLTSILFNLAIDEVQVDAPCVCAWNACTLRRQFMPQKN